jgi:hypothetical protein
MAQNYTFLCRTKTLTILKVAKFDDFNEFRSFCVLKEIGIARIVGDHGVGEHNHFKTGRLGRDCIRWELDMYFVTDLRQYSTVGLVARPMYEG